MVNELVRSTPNEIQAKMPSSIESPIREYSTTGSVVEASSAKMLSSSLVVRVCVFSLYGETVSTWEMRSWSKKTWPTCEAVPPP